ncbi:hypothetical protein RB653_010476 [Dictyostelium firmibasis]|uniref:ADF-H domain-containing protein n=1 Tax=Dictyostelium firmibasis TaxID=79012 RepID=A0AAN7TZD5_9MYCE
MTTPAKPTIAKISPECQTYFQDIKFRNKYQGVIYKVNEESNMVTDKTLVADGEFSELAESLPTDQCRIIIYRYKSGEGSKLFFIYWGPDSAPQQDKLIYGNAKVTLAITLKGIDHKISASNINEISEQVFIDRITPKTL